MATGHSPIRINLKPLSPIALTGNRDASNDWALSWIRRTRTGGEWRDYVDAMLGETSEAYQVDIFSDGTYTTVKRTLSVTSPAYRLHQRRPDDRFRQQPGHALSQDLPTLRHRRPRLSAHAINYEVAMSNSTTLLDLIAQSQSSKEVTANALADAGSPATLFGRRASLCSGLNWFYYGGIMLIDGVLTAISNNAAALALSASTTNYVEATRAGVVSKNTTGFTAGSIPLRRSLPAHRPSPATPINAPGCNPPT